MQDLFDKTGVMAIGTRLRMLSEKMIKESERLYSLYNVDLKPKWFPVIFLIRETNEPITITQIAKQIGHSHVSVVKTVKELSKAELISEIKDVNDGRKTNITLSKKGEDVTKGLDDQIRDITVAMEKMMNQSKHNLWLALEEFEELFEEKSTYTRVLEEKRLRESKNITIIPYEEKYQKKFEELNKNWINEYFTMEKKDTLSLENPQEYILDKGGYILVALYKNEIVGVCALLKSDNENYDYEMAKMAVDENFQGKGIGIILAKNIIHKAKELNAKTIFLESNTILKPAITLYKKLGFKKIDGYSSPYVRSNISMELIL